MDIWAVGVIAYELLFGHVPFFDEYSAEAKKKILNEEPNLDEFSEECKDFMKKLLQKNRDERITPGDALNHKFLAEARISKIRKNSIDETRNSSLSSRISQIETSSTDSD